MLPIIRNQSKWWRDRNINWRASYFVPHAHQKMIAEGVNWDTVGSVVEVGCGAGKNIFMIKKLFPNVQVGGTDINSDAISEAHDIFEEHGMTAELLEVCPADDLFMNDKSADLILTDACLLYVRDIDKVIREFKRVARQGIMFVELHSKIRPQRAWLWWNTGYRAYDYEKLLRRHGFYDITLRKIPKELWSGQPWESFGFVITAKL